MKLVGASNWFVRIPFLLEGMFEGLLGGLMAVGLVVAGYRFLLVGRADNLPPWLRLEVSNDFLMQWGTVLLALGVLVGVLGSGVALRRFLKEA